MRTLPFLAALLGLVASPARADLHYVLDAAHSDIRARVGFLGLASMAARFPSAEGQIALDPEALDRLKLEVTLDARALTAGDKVTRDRLKGPKFLDVEHHPQLRFVGQHFEMTGDTTARLVGDVTARGVTRPATLAIRFADAPAHATLGQPIRLSAQMAINRDAFGMTAYHLIVGRTVTIQIEATMVPD